MRRAMQIRLGYRTLGTPTNPTSVADWSPVIACNLTLAQADEMLDHGIPQRLIDNSSASAAGVTGTREP